MLPLRKPRQLQMLTYLDAARGREDAQIARDRLTSESTERHGRQGPGLRRLCLFLGPDPGWLRCREKRSERVRASASPPLPRRGRPASPFANATDRLPAYPEAWGDRRAVLSIPGTRLRDQLAAAAR